MLFRGKRTKSPAMVKGWQFVYALLFSILTTTYLILVI